MGGWLSAARPTAARQPAARTADALGVSEGAVSKAWLRAQTRRRAEAA